MAHRKLQLATSITALCLSLGMSSAFAVTVSPGATETLPGTNAENYLAGTVLVDNVVNFSLLAAPGTTNMITGKLQERVVKEDGTGTLDFYWRITELAGGSLGAFRLGNFGASTFDANYRLDGLGDVGPGSITRFSGVYDSYANFNFYDINGTNTLGDGQSSKFFFLHTNATNYAKTGIFDIATSGGGSTMTQGYSTFAPAVPEPETYAMMMAGLGLIGAIARRHRNTIA